MQSTTEPLVEKRTSWDGDIETVALEIRLPGVRDQVRFQQFSSDSVDRQIPSAVLVRVMRAIGQERSVQILEGVFGVKVAGDSEGEK
jgi:site-specific DNA-cytosine methylase